MGDDDRATGESPNRPPIRPNLTFRARLVLAATAAVAVAIALASGVIYVVVRGELRSQVDEGLRDRAEQVLVRVQAGRLDIVLPPDPLGGAGGYVQAVTRAGAVILERGREEPLLPVTDRTREVAAGREPAFLDDERIDDVHVRVLTVRVPPGLAVQIARPLTEVDALLGRLRLVLLVVSAAGLGVAAVLGGLVARAALAPVRRLTDTAEHVTATADLTRRIEVTGTDELSRLAGSFNTMLGALERSLRVQRQLVADASHELRTPITSIRTNLEVLARAETLPAGERERLLGDVVGQLEELGQLVTDIVELARGAEPVLAMEDVRLDELVAASVDRAAKLAPQVVFRTSLRPSLVRGVPSRLARAVGNLLDNAAKWSPPGGTVEVEVDSGVVTVRDRGPGIAEEDLPFVFDRFFRSASARGTPGSGLGLAIVKQVAEAHGGTVRAERPEDGGALLRLELPPAPTAPAPPVAPIGEGHREEAERAVRP